MLGLEYSELAERDLEALADWLSDYSPPAALRFLDRIESAVERLRDFPEMGRQVLLGESELRVLPIGPWLLLYRVLADRILVSRIVRGSRDLRRLDTP